MRDALERHDTIVRSAIETYDGYVFSTGGDGFAAAFERAGEALAAAADAQAALQATDWVPGGVIRVRIGVHTGEAAERGGDYFGPTVNRTARLMAVAHGGQVLCSAAVAELVDSSRAGLIDLGLHRLRDLGSPQRVFQVGSGSFPPLRSLDAVATNLPVVGTDLVGRESDVSALEKLLSSERVVTLTGVGGVGKTRLALAVAAGSSHRFPDGCWLVELAPVPPDGDVVRPIAETLGAAASDLGALVGYLSERDALVVLDNCEHVLAQTFQVVAALVRAGKRGAILATSREPLGVHGEVVRAVRPLALPPEEGSAEEVCSAPAVRLFVDRAEAASADFRVNDQTISDVGAICRRLDGIPLALELAAARTRSMPAGEIARRLDERFRLIAGGRGTEDRHRTLLATVSWSYDLLGNSERQVFRRLAVFAGTFNLDAATAIAGDEVGDLSAFDDVLALVERSLVEYDGGTGRYRLLETLRQFAADRLDEVGETEATRNRHADYFRALARQAAPELGDARYSEAKRRLDPELDNLRAAASCLAEQTRWSDLLTLAGDLYYFIMGHAPLDGVEWYRHALDNAQDITPQVRVDAYGEMALIALTIGDKATMDECVAASEALSEAQGLLPAAKGYAALGSMAVMTGDYQGALDVSTRGREVARLRGDVLAEVLADGDADVAFAAVGQPEESRRCGQRGLEVARRFGHPWAVDLVVICRANAQLLVDSTHQPEAVAAAVSILEEHLAGGEVAGLSNAAWLSTVLSFGRLVLRHPDAISQIVASFRIADSVGIPYMIELSLHELALACCRADWPEEGAHLAGYVQGLGGVHVFPAAHRWLDAEIQALRAGFSQEEWEASERAGAALNRRELFSLIQSVQSGGMGTARSDGGGRVPAS
jgi:predicted ATPase